MSNTISDYLSYLNLQMAAESTQIPDGYSGPILDSFLVKGNERSSKTPDSIIKQVTGQWQIASHLENTKTGLSATLFKNAKGEYVMSIRSTEFLDDAVRDTKAADELEVKGVGWALGQLSDLDGWY